MPTTLSAPARIAAADRFELIAELGSGSTGTVWRAWDRQRGTEVALKVLHQLDTSVVRRFKHEFRTLANLRHRNVVRFQELFEIDDRLFFSMELIEGVDLLCWIWGFDEAATQTDVWEHSLDEDTKPNALTVTGPQVDYHRLRAVFAQLTEGLTYVHGAGTLHRDLKPSNLIVDREGHLRILDFGLSAQLAAPLAHELTAAVGTIAYMAPEVAELRHADARADYYGVGVLLFEALTGRTPFPGDHIAAVLAAKATADPPAPSALVSGVPEELDQLCRQLLARDPAQRAGAQELRRVFRVAGRSLPRTSEPPELARGSGAILPPPVVGRGREVDQLAADLARTRNVGFQCRLVVGSSGIGKSTLADAFARRMSASAVVLMGRCHDRETIPFRAVDEVIDSLSHYLSTLTEADRRALTDHIATPLDSLMEMFPVLRGLAPRRRASDGERDPGTLRRQAFQALRELLAAVARTNPLAVLIDDLHLADPDSLDLLNEVFRGHSPPSMLVVGLGRPGSVMDALCAQSSRDGGPAHRVELAPLQGDEAELAARALATYMDVTLTDARSIAIDTGGHPGFMFEILRRAESCGDAHACGPGDSLPTLESALSGSISALTETARRVLELLTVVEGVCSVDLAAEVLGTSLGDIASALDLLVDANLVVATGRGRDDVFEVYHERIREVADAALCPEAVTAIHHALAGSMERRGDVDPARLVHHWRLGGDPARAAHWRTQAAASAIAAYQLQRAAALHEESLQDPLPIELERRVRTELAHVYGFLGRLTDAAAQYLAASRLAPPELALSLSHQAAEALLCAANVDAGGQLIEEVVTALGQAAPRGRGLQLATVIGNSLRGALGRFVPRPTTEGRASLTVEALATASTRVGILEPLRGRVYQQRHLQAARRLGDGVRYARALCAEAVWCAAGGARRRARVDRLLAEAAAVSAHDRSALHRSRLALADAMTSFMLGEFQRARTTSQDALAALEHCGDGPWWELRQAQTFSVWTSWITGEYDQLTRTAPRWASEAREREDSFTHAMMTASTGNEVWLLADDVAGADAHLEAAERMWPLHRVPPMRWHVAAARANLELYRGNPAKALATLDAAEPLARQAGLDRVEALRTTMLHLRLRATLATAVQGAAPPQRKQLMTDAADLSRRLGKIAAPWAHALASLTTATYVEHAGNRDAAITGYRRAHLALAAVHMRGYALAARWRAAVLQGGIEGEDERLAIKRRLGGTIAAPARFFCHLLGV